MKEQKRDVLFSVLLVVVTGFVFFSLGLAAASKFGFAQNKTVIEYQPSDTTTPYTVPTEVVGKVNLNTATAEELMQIDGIGEKTAKDIIAYREQIGKFALIEQLMDVDGIGEKKFNQWRAYLTVDADVTTAVFATGTTTGASALKGDSTTMATVSTAKVPASTTAFSGVLNLNTATKEELMQIKGIGEITAQKIIDYRNQIGEFTSLEQLLNIDGIGEKKLAAWKPYLTLDN